VTALRRRAGSLARGHVRFAEPRIERLALVAGLPFHAFRLRRARRSAYRLGLPLQGGSFAATAIYHLYGH
jgi:hypothetical protein